MELDITGVTDYGVSMDAVVAGQEAIPLHGARFDLAVDGRYRGRLAGRAHGVDYLRVRADGRIELDLHLIIECMSSEHFGQLARQFKRVSGSSGLKVQLRLPADAGGVFVRWF
jgi:hypothetical protein